MASSKLIPNIEESESSGLVKDDSVSHNRVSQESAMQSVTGQALLGRLEPWALVCHWELRKHEAALRRIAGEDEWVVFCHDGSPAHCALMGVLRLRVPRGLRNACGCRGC